MPLTHALNPFAPQARLLDLRPRPAGERAGARGCAWGSAARTSAGWLLALAAFGWASTAAHAQSVPSASPITVDLLASQGRLSAGLADAQAVNLRGTWLLAGGDVARAELLAEDKFDRRGGLAALGYSKVLSPDWVAAGTVALGHGGPNWANTRLDLELSRSWGEARAVVTRLAVYKALFDGSRNDRGLRLALVGYLPGHLVVEAGTAINISEPGSVHSAMPFVAATWGQDGQQYLSLRASRGSEAYQALGVGQQLVGFDSHSLGLGWRRWIGPQWGLTAQAEQYRNPTYRRLSAGVGVFAQW